MADKIIVAVCGHPELCDTSSYFYRNRNYNDLAWKKVSEEVGQSEPAAASASLPALQHLLLYPQRHQEELREGLGSSHRRWSGSSDMKIQCF